MYKSSKDIAHTGQFEQKKRYLSHIRLKLDTESIISRITRLSYLHYFICEGLARAKAWVTAPPGLLTRAGLSLLHKKYPTSSEVLSSESIGIIT